MVGQSLNMCLPKWFSVKTAATLMEFPQQKYLINQSFRSNVQNPEKFLYTCYREIRSREIHDMDHSIRQLAWCLQWVRGKGSKTNTRYKGSEVAAWLECFTKSENASMTRLCSYLSEMESYWGVLSREMPWPDVLHEIIWLLGWEQTTGDKSRRGRPEGGLLEQSRQMMMLAWTRW